MRRQIPLIGWLTAETVSLCGTRLSMIAIPWFVLTTTGSATTTGLVGFAEMAPYVLAKAAGGPLIDRVGAARMSVGADAASAAVVLAIPLLHWLDLLSLPVLLVIVAVAGLLRGPGDAAKGALVPDVVEATGVPMERATGLYGAAERLASTAGAALAGLLVAVLGPVNALLLDAASFAVAAVLIAATGPRRTQATEADAEETTYVQQLRDGWDFLRRDPVLVAMTLMISFTNLLDQAYFVVLVPVWAYDTGEGATAIGILFAVFAGTATFGSLVASAWGNRLPRFATYLVAFLLAGAPRFIVLALDAPLAAVLATAVVGGFACGFINPILSAVLFERIPRHLVGRVSSLNTALCWAGIPFGGLVGGAVIAGIGLSPALFVLGGAYLAATMLPALQPAWRQLDSPAPPAIDAGGPQGNDPTAASASPPSTSVPAS